MMASNDKPRITHHAIVRIGEFLDRASPTKRDWRVFASYLGFKDNWIQAIEYECLPTSKSPTAYVLRAWQQRFSVIEPLPVREQLIECLRKMDRTDAASCVEEMMKEGSFLDSGCVLGSNQTWRCTSQTGQHTSQTNDSTGRSKKSAQENSYHGHTHYSLQQGHTEGCERRMKVPTFPSEHQLTSPTYYQPHQPKNGQSVVSLSSVVSDKSENLPMTSHWNNTKTWPLKRGDDMNSSAQDRHLSPSHVSNRGQIQHQFHPMELETLFLPQSNYHHQLSQDDESLESRPFHSLVSTTSVDGRHPHEDRAHAALYSQGTVDRMMMENPTRASPNQTLKRASVLITYAYKNYKTAHRLASLLKSQGHEVTVDNKAPIEGPTFTSVTYVIIIYTQDYFKEVTGIVESPLNTPLICNLMAKEFNRLGKRNLRFVPIFDHERINRDTIPCFLRNYPKQPTQYICKILDNSLNTPTRGEISIQRRVYISH